MRFLIASVFVFTVYAQSADAQALPSPPPYSEKVPQLFGEVLKQRGHANDNIRKTVSATARVVARQAPTYGVSASRLAWLTIPARLNAVGAAITLGIAAYELYNWYYSDDGYSDNPKVQVGSTTPLTPIPKPENDDREINGYVSANFVCRDSGFQCAKAENYRSFVQSLEQRTTYARKFQVLKEDTVYNFASTNTWLTGHNARTTFEYEQHDYSFDNDGNAIAINKRLLAPATYTNVANARTYRPPEDPPELFPSCMTGTGPWPWPCGVAPDIQLPNTVAYPLVQKPLFIPNQFEKLPSNPGLASETFDDLWKRAAAMEDYDGIPYPFGDPLTKAELEALMNKLPALWPSVEDWASPVAKPDNSIGWDPIPTYVTGPQPGTNPNPNPNPNPGTGGPIDPGTYPSVPEPTLEVPTIAQILGPVLNMFPDAKTMTTPSFGSSCPSITLDPVIMEPVEVRSHCDVTENNRALISAIFIALFTTTSLVVVLRA